MTENEKGQLRDRHQQRRPRLTRYSNHVLDSVITIGKVVKRSRLVNDTNLQNKNSSTPNSRKLKRKQTYSSFLSTDLDVFDVIGRLSSILELLVNDVSGFGSGLSVWEIFAIRLAHELLNSKSRSDVRNSAGKEILKRTFSMML